MSLKRIIHEVHRRSIWQVLLIYLGGSWFVLQVVDQVQTRLSLPPWVYGGAIILLLIGLPIVLATAFVQEAPAAPHAEESVPQRVLTWRNAIGGGLLAFIGGGAALVLWLNFSPSKEIKNAQPSVAVLPFVDMSPTKDQEYFGDGITEEILNVLAQLPDLRVPGRTSSFSFKGKNLSIKEIAQQLGVANILEGSIRKSGDKVRITAQLIDAKSDKHIWSETYDRDISDVFAVQDEIAHAIVDALKLHMAGEMVAKGTESGRAHETYLKGLYYWHRRHIDEMPKALELMREATREDPSYARAWAGLALADAVVPQYGTAISRDDAIREGKAAAQKAIQLDPKSADAYAALGQIAQELEWDWKAAEEHLNRALEIDPQYATAHQWRAELYLELGQYNEAQAEIDRAIEIDPLASVMLNIKGFGYGLAGQGEKAIPVLKAMDERDPGFAFAKSNLFNIYVTLKRYDDALAMTKDTILRGLIAGVLDAREKPRALQILADTAFRRRSAAHRIATFYLALGVPDSAASVLNQAAAAWQPSIGYIPRSPIFAAIRDQPQFIEFKRRVHLD